MKRKATNRHVFLRMVREVEMSLDRFRSVFIVYLNIPKCVISFTHELVYHVIHDHICLNKADQCSTEPLTSSLTKESDDKLYRHCGAALQRMVKLKWETLEGKK